MSNDFASINKGEILSLNHQDVGRQLNMASHGFTDLQIKAEQFTEVITRRLNITDTQGESLFDKGISCEVMRFGASGWQKGRLRARVILEFCPEEPPVEEKPITNEPESSLDDIQRMMREENPNNL